MRAEMKREAEALAAARMGSGERMMNGWITTSLRIFVVSCYPVPLSFSSFKKQASTSTDNVGIGCSALIYSYNCARTSMKHVGILILFQNTFNAVFKDSRNTIAIANRSADIL